MVLVWACINNFGDIFAGMAYQGTEAHQLTGTAPLNSNNRVAVVTNMTPTVVVLLRGRRRLTRACQVPLPAIS